MKIKLAENNKQILKSVNEENISASLKSVVIKSLMNFGGIKKSSKSQISFKISSPVKINLPLKAGWLKKKTPNPLVKWQKRYCRIENKKFFYYKNDKEMHPLGCLNFDLISVKFEENIKDKKIIQFRYFKLKKTKFWKLKKKIFL